MEDDSEEGHSTPRASRARLPAHSLVGSVNPLRFNAFASTSSLNSSPSPSRTPSSQSVAGTKSKENDGVRSRRQLLLHRAREHEKAGLQLAGISGTVLRATDPRIQEDILRLIEQYLGDEGFLSTKLVLHDEANLKSKERDERANEGKKLRRAILDGDWTEVDQIVSKPLVRTQKALLYSLYKQQFLEHIEYRELQKARRLTLALAFTLLIKRIKPLEHFQPTPNEFRDLCYLLSAKSVHDAPSFKNWEGVDAAREKLVEAFEKMVEGEREEKEESVFVPPGRLVTLLEQAVSYQIELSRYRPKEPPAISSLLHDYSPFIVPNSLASVLEGHTANIKSVRFVGASGQHLVSGSSDNTVRVWDTLTSTCKAILRGHTSRIWEVDASAKGDRVSSASGDRSVKVWNWDEQDETRDKCATTLEGNGGDVYSARWHPMGNHIATGGFDKIVRLYDVESRTILTTFTGHSLSISSVLFNPLGNLIVSGSKDSHVRFWDSVSGLCIRTLNAQLGEITSVDMSDVYLLTSSRDNSIRLWDVRMLRPLRRFKSHSNTTKNFVRASFAHSSLLVSGSEDGTLYMWDRESSEVLQTLEGHEGVVYGAAWNDRQSLLASYGSDGDIRTWEYDDTRPFADEGAEV